MFALLCLLIALGCNADDDPRSVWEISVLYTSFLLSNLSNSCDIILVIGSERIGFSLGTEP